VFRVLARSVARRAARFALCLAPLAAVQAAAPPDYLGAASPAERAAYREALDAAGRGDWKRFEALSAQLSDYPLQSYLAYERLLAERRYLPGDAARAFVDANRDSPLGVRFLGHYLESAGSARRWEHFLAAAQDAPRSESLRCYYYRARLAEGDREAALAGARRMWLSPRSVDEACDPLFTALRHAGAIDDALVWERAMLTFEARQGSLLRYVASLGSPGLQGDLEVLRRVYREPQRTLQLARAASDLRRDAVVSLGLVRLSRYDPGRALALWRRQDPTRFTPAQTRDVESAIALRGLLEDEASVMSWVDGELGRWADDKLTGLRLRRAIEGRDWNSYLSLSAHLSDAAADDAGWLYWRARALEALKRGGEAEQVYARVARRRSYYGFLSADRIGVPYSFNEDNRLPDASGLPPLAQRTTRRVLELDALDEARDAHAEWTHTLGLLDRSVQQQLAGLAAQQGWHHLAIDAANRSGSRDALALRFPIAYAEVFRRPAAQLSLPVSELMAIARRESAFFPAARSPANARGLMQLLPSTGLGLARRQGLSLTATDLYDVDYNVALGSAYYRQLLERFDGNRAVALAAYNAGPNRVQHWIGKGLPVDAWIESIPYRETREYVKAVLAYSVVFDHRLGQEARLLSAAEIHRAY
jgi:soluble lytic murein transglycosylase